MKTKTMEKEIILVGGEASGLKVKLNIDYANQKIVAYPPKFGTLHFEFIEEGYSAHRLHETYRHEFIKWSDGVTTTCTEFYVLDGMGLKEAFEHLLERSNRLLLVVEREE